MRRELNTERLLLRDPRPGDALVAHARWAGDADVLRYLAWLRHATAEQTQAMLRWDEARWLKGSACTWLMVLRDGAPGAAAGPIGLVQLVRQQLDGPAFHWRLGYVLAPPWRGRGLMREAVRAVVAEAWSSSEARRVDAICDVDNAASRAVLAACGFAQEGLLRRHTVHPNIGPEPRDVTMHAVLRP